MILMKVMYDNEHDILYLIFKEEPVHDTVEACEDVYVEFNEKREVIGVEIWRASELVVKPIADKIVEKIQEFLED